MPIYGYKCTTCDHYVEKTISLACYGMPILCGYCNEEMPRYYTPDSAPYIDTSFAIGITKNKMDYYGIKNVVTGEGITKDTDVRDKPGIRVKPIKVD